MATTRTVQRPAAGGSAHGLTAADATGDKFVNTGREFLVVKNADASSKTVTVSSGANACSFGVANVAHDRVVIVLTGTEVSIGPFDPGRFNDGTGFVNVAYSAVTSVTVGVFSL